ncbi:MAG TPA: hypothetical protein VM511_13240 [Luteolibacter sp.]|nr:hypothetical protein [Luteolibacter sp.]
MLRRFLAAYGKGLDATVRLLGMYFTIALLSSGSLLGVHWLVSRAYPAAADEVTTVVGIIILPFICRIAIYVGGLQTIPRSLPAPYKSPDQGDRLTPPEPPPSPRSLPAGR